MLPLAVDGLLRISTACGFFLVKIMSKIRSSTGVVKGNVFVFPVLMVTSMGRVVLFKSQDESYIVRGTVDFPRILGDPDDMFSVEHCIPFDGEVTLHGCKDYTMSKLINGADICISIPDQQECYLNIRTLDSFMHFDSYKIFEDFTGKVVLKNVLIDGSLTYFCIAFEYK